jgi:hypothetical protein
MATDVMDIDRGWNRVEYSRDGGRKGAVRARSEGCYVFYVCAGRELCGGGAG